MKLSWWGEHEQNRYFSKKMVLVRSGSNRKALASCRFIKRWTPPGAKLARDDEIALAGRESLSTRYRPEQEIQECLTSTDAANGFDNLPARMQHCQLFIKGDRENMR
jgi:hypothetical protein